jgi:SAM-dependent methyltransferase
MANAFFRQFGRPEGALGAVVGHLMAWKNGERSRWALELLAPRPGERVLEIGFGPGVDLGRLLAATAPGGRVAGVDPSAVMNRQAAGRNRAAIRSGALEVRLAEAAPLPFADGTFDAVYSSNSAFFWHDVPAALREVARVLRRGGRALVSVQPMWRGAGEADTERWRATLEDALRAAGLGDVRSSRRDLRGAPAVAVQGTRPPL